MEGGGGGDILENESHPLLIDVILKVVFENLQAKDLKKCRLVCPIWNSAVLASRSWKRRVNVRIDRDGKTGPTAEDFLSLVDNGNGRCFSKMITIHYGDTMGETFAISQQFWLRCGAWIKILRLQAVKFESVEEYRRVIYEACPNMEQLGLGHIAVTRCERDRDILEPSNYLEPQFGEKKNMRLLSIQGSGGDYGVSWMEILSHFPNLKALHMNCAPSHLSGLWTAFSKIREKFPNKLKLKHITCHTPHTEVFSILKDPGLELQSIGSRACPNVDDLKEILAIHVSTLKKLSLSNSTGARNIDPNRIFPLQPTKLCSIGLLDALEILEFGQDVFVTMAILKFTPNLRFLKIVDWDGRVIRNTKLSEMSDVSLKKCTRLVWWTSVPDWSGSLRKLIAWIPNVKELKLNKLGNAHFQIICESWPDLITLVCSGRVNDMGITGLDEVDVRRINEAGESGSWRPITVPRANITALKCLRNLNMEVPNPYYLSVIELGYCAAVCGVEQLPKLQRLDLIRCKLTGCRWDFLHSRFPNRDNFDWSLEDNSSPIIH